MDRRIFVVGFGIYGAIHGPSEHSVAIGLVNVRTGEVSAAVSGDGPGRSVETVRGGQCGGQRRRS